MLEDDTASAIEKMMENHHQFKKSHEDFMAKHMAMKDSHEKMMAERDSLRDKDHHDPEAVHHPLEEDEIGSEGKEKKDPDDSYGMESHVKDYEKPSNMENHAVESPKNEHYPKDLPHINKVDAAEVNRRVNQRVKLVRLSEKYLDKATLSRIDSMDDIELKKRLILNMQPNAQLQGKSATYINARFDAAIEDQPAAKVIAFPSSVKTDEDDEKNGADQFAARKAMIKRQKSAWMGRK